MMHCCDVCPFSPTCEEEDDQARHSYRPREDWGDYAVDLDTGDVITER